MHPQVADDTPLRIQIARAEARRADGVAELVQLARSGDVHQKQLALRGLGRIGTPAAIETLRDAVQDADPAVATAAIAALGVAAMLDDTPTLVGDAAHPLHFEHPLDTGKPPAPKPTPHEIVARVEALGRGGGVTDQRELVRVGATAAPEIRAAAAIALGVMGRRKLALEDASRDALVKWTHDPDRDVRYAAAYALAREHEPQPFDAVTMALGALILDNDPEIRATAIAGLARRKSLAGPDGSPAAAARQQVATSLRDTDWRVAVEAVRALATDDAGREVVAGALQRRWRQLENGNAPEAQVVTEALRALAKHPIGEKSQSEIAALATSASKAATLPIVETGWVACLAVAVLARARGDLEPVRMCGQSTMSPMLHMPLLADLVTAGAGSIDERRRALRALLEHTDVRVRAAGLGALPSLWKDGSSDDHRTIVSTLIAALQVHDPIIAGSAVDAATELYDVMGDVPERNGLDAAVVKRAGVETDVELSASLLALVGKRALASGAAACTAHLRDHVVVARAAAACMKALGEAVKPIEVGATKPPPVDVADVIGKDLRWHLATSRGEIVIQLRPDVAPWAVATIVALTQKGAYDHLEFHRVVPDFVVQGGDPTQSGWGGPGFTTPAEPATSLDGDGFAEGGVGIADAGRDSGGSQYFVMHSRAPHLDGRYTWIGTVVSGQKYADALLIGDTVDHASVETRNCKRSEDVSTACK